MRLLQARNSHELPTSIAQTPPASRATFLSSGTIFLRLYLFLKPVCFPGASVGLYAVRGTI